MGKLEFKGKININDKYSKSLKLYHTIHKCRYIAKHTKSIRILKKEKKRIHITIRKIRKLYIG